MSKQIGSMHHVGILVRDLRQAEAFVTAALGLPVVKRLKSAELGVSMVFLACGPALVELIEYADPQLVQERLGDRRPAIGVAFDQQLADALRTRSAAGFSGLHDIDAALP